jgi:Arc/MetJ-type ribon-helix-helix transcriptional regulator
MRPKIPDQLAERIQQVHESAGYATESEFVRDAIRRRLEEVESAQNVTSETRVHDFEFTTPKSTSLQFKNDEYPPIFVRPEGSRITDHANEGSLLVLSINGQDIESEDITGPVEELDVVADCRLTREDPWDRKTETDGWIEIRLAADHVSGTDLDTVVDTILTTIDEAIVGAESWKNPHKELEDALERHIDN